MYLVVSTKNNQNGYYKTFETKTEAEKFLNTEEYDFRDRELYDLSDESSYNDFKRDWCYEPAEGETDEEVESKGYIWDDEFSLYHCLEDRTDSHIYARTDEEDEGFSLSLW